MLEALLNFLQSEFLLAAGLHEFAAIVRSGDLEQLWSLEGAGALLALMIPGLLAIEIFATWLRGSFRWRNFRMQLFIYLTNRAFALTIGIAVGLSMLTWAQPYRLFETGFTWYWFIYAYLVYEFSHYIYHWLAHRVRLFWCLHSTHHSPTHMNLSVSYAHFFLEGPYADIVRIGICTVLGVDPILLLIVLGIDSIWGHVIHLGEELLPDGRMGSANRWILTPAHHRVHHSSNPEYIDRNYCNLLPIWDRVFGTYQEQLDDVPPRYGVSRKINTDSLVDIYFGEIIGMLRDIRRAPGLGNKLAYLFKPPGWHPAEVLAAHPELTKKTPAGVKL